MAMVPLGMSEVQAEVSLVDKLNTKSTIWKYFGFVPDDDGTLRILRVKYAVQLFPRR